MSLAIIFALLIPLFTALVPSKAYAAQKLSIDNQELVARTGLTVGDSNRLGTTVRFMEKNLILPALATINIPTHPVFQAAAKNGFDSLAGDIDWEDHKENIKAAIDPIELLKYYVKGSEFEQRFEELSKMKDFAEFGKKVTKASGWVTDYNSLDKQVSKKAINVLVTSVMSQQVVRYEQNSAGLFNYLDDKSGLKLFTTYENVFAGVENVHFFPKAKLPHYDGVDNPRIFNKSDVQLLLFDIYQLLKNKSTQTEYGDYAKKLLKDYNALFYKYTAVDGGKSKKPSKPVTVCKPFEEAFFYFDQDNYYNAVYYGDIALKSCNDEGITNLMELATSRLLEVGKSKLSQGDSAAAFKYFNLLVEAKNVPNVIRVAAENELKYYHLAQLFNLAEDHYSAVYYAGKAINAGYANQVSSLLKNSSTKLSMEADADANEKKFNDAVVKYRILMNTYGVPDNIKAAATKNESSIMKEYRDAKYYYAQGGYHNAVHYASVAVAKGLWLEEVTSFLNDASGKLSAQADQKANNKQYSEAIKDYNKLIGAYGVPERIKQAAQKNIDSIYNEYTLADGYYKKGDYYNAVYYSAQSLAKGLSEQKIIDLVKNSSTQLSMLADKKAANKEYNQAVLNYGLLMNAKGVPDNIKQAATTNYNKIYTEYSEGIKAYNDGNYYNAVHYASLSYAKGVTTAEVNSLLKKAAEGLSAQADKQANSKQYNEAINNYEKIKSAYGVPENIKQAVQANLNSIFKEYDLGKKEFDAGNYYNAVYNSVQSLAKGVSVQKVIKLVNDSSTQLSILADKQTQSKNYNQAVLSYNLLMSSYGVPENIKQAASKNYHIIYEEYKKGNQAFNDGNFAESLKFASQSFAKGVTTAEVQKLLKDAAGKLSAQADEDANNKKFKDAWDKYAQIIGAYGVPENIVQAAKNNQQAILSEYNEGKRYYDAGNYYNAVHYTSLSVKKGVNFDYVVKQLNDAATKLSWQADADATNKKYNDAVMKYRMLFNSTGVPTEIQNPAKENEKKIMEEYRTGQFYFDTKSYFNAVHFASLSMAKGLTLEEVKTLMNKAASELSKAADANANAGNKELAINQYKKLIGDYGVPENIKQAAQSNLNNLTK
ncbi:hypothetical protein [Bacillus cereus]|uniref:hypothetical protein n=1 Tax=Bacillus cereus TaxID=1396 RepID=UPI0011251830|nr:hypothetical protein [Bacillus cereus]